MIAGSPTIGIFLFAFAGMLVSVGGFIAIDVIVPYLRKRHQRQREFLASVAVHQLMHNAQCDFLANRPRSPEDTQ